MLLLRLREVAGAADALPFPRGLCRVLNSTWPSYSHTLPFAALAAGAGDPNSDASLSDSWQGVRQLLSDIPKNLLAQVRLSGTTGQPPRCRAHCSAGHAGGAWHSWFVLQRWTASAQAALLTLPTASCPSGQVLALPLCTLPPPT